MLALLKDGERVGAEQLSVGELALEARDPPADEPAERARVRQPQRRRRLPQRLRVGLGAAAVVGAHRRLRQPGVQEVGGGGGGGVVGGSPEGGSAPTGGLVVLPPPV